MSFKPIRTQICQTISQPILAPILANRNSGLAIVGVAVLHMGFVMAGIPSWECPILHNTGVPCPGCGLSRAISALWHGDWQTSLTYHALAPFFLIGLLFTAIVTFLPQKYRTWTLKRLTHLETQTGFVGFFLIVLLFYWLLRLFISRNVYTQLMLNGSV